MCIYRDKQTIRSDILYITFIQTQDLENAINVNHFFFLQIVVERSDIFGPLIITSFLSPLPSTAFSCF